jgi:hypothetical protein
MYRFDYCDACFHLYTLNELQCPNCYVDRFKITTDASIAMDKKMKNFFLCADLKEIQQSFYEGNSIIHFNLIDNICFESMKSTIALKEESHEYIGDIYTGNIYSQHVQEGRLGTIWQTSYSMCTDGVR